MSKAAVGFASILVAGLALCATNASAMSIFEKGGAQDVKNVSDGYFTVNGKINENGSETYDIAELSHQPALITGDFPLGLSTLGQNSDFGRSENGDFGGAENSDSTTPELSSSGNSFATDSLTSTTAGSGSGNGIGGSSSAGDGPALTSVKNRSFGGKGSHLTNSDITAATTNTAIVNDPADDPVAAPLPAALPLFATGLGGLGLLGWRRKRKVKAVVP